MNPLLPLLSAPAALSALHVAKEATSAAVQPFAALLASYSNRNAALASIDSPSSLATSPASQSVLSSGENDNALAKLRDEVGRRLGDLFNRRGMNSENEKSTMPMRLRVDSANRTITVEGNHPDASWLESAIASDEALSRAIDQLAILSRQAESPLERGGSSSLLAELTPPSSPGAIVSLRWL